jgi:uncharacterized Fe-S cluster protein YjdI
MKVDYSNNKLIVHWDSDRCIRAGRCDGQLPLVFNIYRRPWVDINAADPETIRRVIDTCPTGALSYEIPGKKSKPETIIKIMEDGPYKVTGKCSLIKENGDKVEADGPFALCRCGASKKMPFCDGSHVKIGFHNK